MKISFNNFKKLYGDEKPEILSAVERVLDSGFYILGQEVKEFENNFSSYIGAQYGIGVANGLEAIQISLLASGIKEGDEIITTPLSAVATVLAHKAVGAKTVFADIDTYYHIDADKIEEKITPKTKVIMPVHIYGQASNMKKIMEIAQKYNLLVIEDCAQAHGSMIDGKKAGNFGTAGCFSFYPTKNLGTLGDGGMITTNDIEIAEKCRALRNYGQKNRYEHETEGINSRLDEVHAAILSTRLPKLDHYNNLRRGIAEIYYRELSNTQVTLPEIRNNAHHVYHLFVIETPRRDELQSFLQEKGVDTLIHYPIPLHKQKCFPEYNILSLPVVERKTSSILSLPIHPHLTTTEVLYICDQIKAFFSKK